MQDWQSIVEEHGPMVWKITYRLLANFQDSQDCFQETFLSALEVSRDKPIRNLRALLVKIANSRAIDRLRRRLHRDRNGGACFDACSRSDPGPDEQMHSAELAGQLRRALSEVPQDEAEIFCLRFLDDLSYRQIAKATGLKTNAVGVMLHRVRHRLREILERQEKGVEKKVSYNNET